MSKADWTLQEKVRLLCDLACDERLTGHQFRVAAVLIQYFHNTTSGQCFPSYEQLAAAAKVSKLTAKRATHKLREMGVINFEQSTGGRCKRNSYTLLKGDTSAPFNDEKGCHQRTRPVSPAHPLEGVTSAPAYTQRIYPRRRSEASPSPLKRVEASQKKKEGLQREPFTKASSFSEPQNQAERSFTVDDETRAKNLAKLVKAGAKRLYAPALSQEEQLAQNVEADLRKYLGPDMYQIVVERLTPENVAQAARVESRKPGHGFRTLAMLAGFSTGRWVVKPLADDVHGPEAPAVWVEATRH